MNAKSKSKPKHGKTLTILRVVTIATVAMILTLSMTTIVGCASSQTALKNPLPVDTSEYDLIFQAAMDVLQNQGYRLDRHDYRFGVVTTYPKVSPTLGEPWYSDNTTAQQAVASTVNYQRRRVNIRLVPDPEATAAAAKQLTAEQAIASSSANPLPGGYLLDAQVLIEQVETPLRYLTGSTASGRIARDLRDAPADLKERNIKENYWRVIGRDTGLEQKLMADILRKTTTLAQKQPVATNQETPDE